MSQKIEKINLNDITNEYEVKNVEAFSQYLKQVWKDLSGRNKDENEGIDKITFQKYYELPGLISERLFSVFDSSGSGYLSLDDFIDNMLILFSSNFEKLLKFIMKFYDFDNDGKITKEDVRVVLSYVPIYKKSSKGGGLKFEKDNFEDRLKSQKELHDKLDAIFDSKEKINLEEFTSIIKNKNSDMFLFILVFLYEHRPFSAETVKNLENIKKSPRLSPRKKDNLIASPNLNSNLIVSQTLQRSPAMKALSLGDKNKNPSVYKNMKFLGLLSGKNIEPESQKKESIPLTYSLKIPGAKIENNKKEVTNGENQKKPVRKNLKLISEMDKKEEKNIKYDEMDESDLNLAYARPFEGGDLPKKEKSEFESAIEMDSASENEDNENKNDLGEDDIANNNDNITEGYLYKIQGNKMKKIYFKLICKDLYYYKSKEHKKHKGMHNLSGVYIKDEGTVTINDKKLYCFNVIFPSKERKYYVLDENEYIKWVESIRKVVHYSNLNDLYEIKGDLGKGKFGLVKLGIHKESGREVAVKIINKKLVGPVDVQQVKSEIDILKIAKHPNIIKLYDVFENEKFIYIIMEYCAGGDLFSYIEKRGFKLKEERAAEIIHKLCTTVYFLHQYGIVHRDLKPENILMTDDTDSADIRLVDFGLGKIIGPGETCTEPFGTFSYVAPEVLQEKPYNFKVDLFAIGIITYLLVAGFLPFDHETSEKEIARQTVYEPTPFPSSIWKNISIEAKMFVDNLLDKDPEKRMNIQEVLQHKWLQKFNKEEEKVVFQRRKSRELSGAEKFEVFSTMKNNEK
jgi:Ca2+-binding EF-hand superfamily protein